MQVYDRDCRQIWTNFTPFLITSVLAFDQVNGCWDRETKKHTKLLLCFKAQKTQKAQNIF